MLTEIIRVYFNCSIDNARKIIESINESKVPIIADVDGFVRVQNTALKLPDKIITMLYYKNPTKVKDSTLLEWSKYSKSNTNRFKSDVLGKLDADALIHYDKDGFCTLMPKGILYVEKNIDLELTL